MGFWSNSIDFIASLGANMAEHASEMKLYIILATLENFMLQLDCFNHKMILSQAKPVKFSLAMVGFL